MSISLLHSCYSRIKHVRHPHRLRLKINENFTRNVSYKELYWNLETAIKIDQELLELVRIKRDVRERCVLLTYRFNIYKIRQEL